MTDADRYEIKVLMHRIQHERGEQTPDLVERLAGYVGWHNAVEFDRAVVQMAIASARIEGLLDGFNS